MRLLKFNALKQVFILLAFLSLTLFTGSLFGQFQTHPTSGNLYHYGSNVGIGTNSPKTSLQVSTGQEAGMNSTENGFLMLGLIGASPYNLIMDRDAIQSRYGYAPSNLFINNGGGDIRLGGKLGLHFGGSVVLGRNFKYQYLNDKGIASGPVSTIRFESNGAVAFKLGTATTAGATVSYLDNGVPSLFIQNDGKVGVGANNIGAEYRFVVEGKIGAREIEVTTNSWADYVFADDYELMDLKEVEDYISRHKHLPNIPSASQVVGEGLELGEMQIKMMEKIEELTLYIIDQEKRIGELESLVHEKH